MSEAAATVIALLERIAIAEERQAAALERIATEPSGRLPARKRTQRREHVARVEAPVDDLALAKARKALERVGLR